MDPMNDDELLPEDVRDVVPLLAHYAFGTLEGEDRARVEEALASSELVRILYRDLEEAAAALDEADPAHIEEYGEPPPGLEQRILAAARRRTPPWRAITAAAASVIVLAAGFTLATRDTVPREAVTFAAAPQGVEVLEADLIAHTWGTELELVIEGFPEGTTYMVSFLDEAGERVDAGSFLGVAEGPVICRMNAALLRDDATGVVVRTSTGEVVLEADLA